MTAATLVAKRVYHGRNEEVHVVTFNNGETYTPSPKVNVQDYTWSANAFNGTEANGSKLVYSAGVFTFTATGTTANTAWQLSIRVLKGR